MQTSMAGVSQLGSTQLLGNLDERVAGEELIVLELHRVVLIVIDFQVTSVSHWKHRVHVLGSR